MLNIVKTEHFKKVSDKLVKQKTKKCQPAEGGTQDLIQTWCVPLSRLARQNKKNKRNEKNKTKKNFNKVTMLRNDKPEKH